MEEMKSFNSGITRKRIRLIYILAASHSGSTLLSMLLGSHPEICTVGELKANSLGDIECYRCSCGRMIRECPFWMNISRDMARRGFTFDITNAGTDIRAGASRYVRRLLRPLHRGTVLEAIRDTALNFSSTWRGRLPRIQAVNEALLHCISERTGKEIIVDSSKTGIRLKYLLRNPGLKIQVIRLIRDGRGVALTYIDPVRFADAQDPEYRGGGAGKSRESERLSIEEAAREWRRSNEEAETIIGKLDRSQWTEVHYEKLCSHPDETLRKLFTFIGVVPVKVTSNFRSVEHHIVGNGMRFDSSNEIKLDDRWKYVLKDSDLKVFESVAGKMNRQLGYQCAEG